MEESQCIAPWPFASCGNSNAGLLPFLIAAYVMITNILLINLLIAMFNDTVRVYCLMSIRHTQRLG